MDSDDDMHDAIEVGSMEDEDEDYFSGGEEEDAMEGRGHDDDDDTGDYEFIANYYDDGDDVVSSRSQKNYCILKEEDIRQRQEEDITKVYTVLSISRHAACILLRRYNWSVNNVHEEWFADEDRVRKAVGLLENPISKPLNRMEATCGICFECYPGGSLQSASCPHLFVLHAGKDMINKFAPNEDKLKYNRYLLRSYVEDSRKIKWCPAPGCDSAVEYFVGSGNYDVTCSCSYSFCWNCTEEAHRPVDCNTVEKWILKNSAESENMNWILANSKPCPKCKRPIEKNQGCMHMTCTPPCKFEFCWLCLGAWTDHGERTGGFYACNRYEAAKQEGVYDETERRREMAKNSLERYTHYYERWASNQTSRQKALADLNEMQNIHLEKLSERQCQPESQLKFVVEAWQQIVECRRVLKWTYAYGYYLPEHEQTRKQFFEYLQGEAEAGLERLHQCAEKELRIHLHADCPSKDFDDFRTKLAGLTSVTCNYFENLVRALENGLSDVDPQATSSNKLNPKITVGNSSKSKGGKGKGSSSLSTRFRSTDDSAGNWACDRCTYVNVRSATACHMCRRSRP